MPVTVDDIFHDEKILYTANLKSAFSRTVSSSGDTINGALVVQGDLTYTGDLVGDISLPALDSAANTANNAYNLAAASYSYANDTSNLVSVVYNTTNTVSSVATSALVLASNTSIKTQSAYDLTNSSFDLSHSAFNQANAALVQANLNYNFSNTFVSANISVTGGTQLTISGNTIAVVSANLASTTKFGVVQLNDTVLSNSTSLAATANAVNAVFVNLALPAILVANGSTQNTATKTQSNFLNLVTSGGNNTGIQLNGTVIYQKVVNKTANNILVYPFVGAQIDSYGGNNPILLPNTYSIEFATSNSTQVYIL